MFFGREPLSIGENHIHMHSDTKEEEEKQSLIFTKVATLHRGKLPHPHILIEENNKIYTSDIFYALSPLPTVNPAPQRTLKSV